MANETKLINLVDPQVMGDLVNYKMVDMIKFSELFTIDTTLVGRPGSKITLPKFGYIGDAENFLEGEAIGYGVLTETSVDVPVKKAGRGVKLTDEAMISGYGDPQGEAVTQIATAIAQKVDNDVHTELKAIKVGMTVGDGTKLLGTELVELALEKFGEDVDGKKALLIAPKQVAQLRADPNFIPASDIRAEMMLTGSLGQILGCDIIISNKIKATTKKFNNFIVKEGAGRIFLKRGVEVETDRDIDAKLTKINADEHYAVYIYDESKAVKIVALEATVA